MGHVRFSVATVAAVVGLAAGGAQAGPVFEFSRITNNGSVDVASQMTMEVESVDMGRQVDFIFRNTGSVASSITGIFFDDGSLLNIASLMNGSEGVSFLRGGNTQELPGGGAIDFNTTADFFANASPPEVANGVNPGEVLTIRFELIFGQNPMDTLGALALAMANPGVDVENGLRVGLLVALESGEFDSFVNRAHSVGGGPGIPLPSAAAMGMAGLFAVAGRRRRRVV